MNALPMSQASPEAEGPGVPMYVSHLSTSSKSEPPCYKIKKNLKGKLGKALIFNHVYFSDPGLNRTTGSQNDITNLEAQLNKLGFEVDIKQDLTLEGIKRVLHSYSQNVNHSSYSCFVICVLTHGSANGFLHAYDQLYNIDLLVEPFSADNCYQLANKPKLYFIEACQSLPPKEKLIRTEVDGIGNIQVQMSIPKHADFFISLAAFPGSYAAKDHNGTWYIQSLCQAFEKYNSQWNLVDIITKVHYKVGIKEGFRYKERTGRVLGKEYIKQCCCFTSSLMGHVYFS